MTIQQLEGSQGHRDKTANQTTQSQKAFGRSYGLTIEAQITRGGEKTLCLEFCAAKEVGGNREYDWENKLIIQLKADHLPLYTAALLGDLEHLRLDHYGAERNKSLEIKINEKGELVISGLTAGKGHAVPVPPDRAFWLGVQALGRICEQADGAVDGITARALVRRTAENWQKWSDRKRKQS